MDKQLYLTASIVVYNNRWNTIKKAVDSFLSLGDNVRLYVVDNSPANNLQQFFTCDDRIEYLFQNCNKGFGAGHNVILRQKEKLGKYHIILNPDVYFDRTQIEGMYVYMEEAKDVALLLPKVLNVDGSIQNLCRLMPDPIYIFGRRMLPDRMINKRIRKEQLLDYDYSKIIDIPYVSGCFMFLRSDILSSDMLFDERFFMYFEDVDLSRRIHKQYRTVLNPFYSIYHAHASEHRVNKRLFMVSLISGVKYYCKWGWFVDRERRKMNEETLKKAL